MSNDAVINRSLTAIDWVTAGAIFAFGVVTGRVLKSLLARTIKRRDSEHAVYAAATQAVRHPVRHHATEQATRARHPQPQVRREVLAEE